MKINMISGNPSPGGRTSALALDVGQALVELLDFELSQEVFEISEISGTLFQWGAPATAALKERLSEAQMIVIATPTYKASYSGLLKAFLDQYGAGELAGTVVVPIFTAGSDTHSMAPDTTLRPLLGELGASVPTRSLYCVSHLLDSENTIAQDFVHAERYQLLGAAHGLMLQEAAR